MLLEHEGGDQYAAVRNARLLLQGPLKGITIHEPYRQPSERFALAWRIHIRGASAEDHTQLLSQHSFRLDVHTASLSHRECRWLAVYDAMALSPQTAGHDIDLHGLLLQVVVAARGVYRRIGVAKWWINESTRAQQEDILLQPAAQCELPCVEFDSGFYAIEVV